MKSRIQLCIFLICVCSCVNEKERADLQFGVYKLDIHKTDLGLYMKDSNKYRDLKIIFKEDYTFELNKLVPFIFDSCGTWEIGNDQLYEWNRLRYKKSKISTQFYQCCDDDSTFLMNSVTPQKGCFPVYKIWFKKISGKFK